MDENIKNLLVEGAKKLGAEIDYNNYEKFDILLKELIAKSKLMNLTAITKPEDIIVKHFLDSLTILKYVPEKENVKVIDIGCGAGFPGLPILIARNDTYMTFLDGTEKKLRFIEETAVKMNLSKKIRCIHGRAEDEGRKPSNREKYDVVTARAVAELAVLAEYCLPFVKKDGIFMAMKGPDITKELNDAENAIKILSGKIEKVDNFTLPNSDISRSLVVIRKVKNTPIKYPRISAKISKKHL